MEYEIHDDPQGLHEEKEAYRDGGVVEDHIALQNQSSVTANDYPVSERRAQSLVHPSQPE